MSGPEKYRIDVLAEPATYEGCPPGYWEGRVAVVIDVLRATSTIVTALAEGYSWVLPCREIDKAREEVVNQPRALLAGEREGLPPEGFAKGNSPREFLGPVPPDQGVILTTTNGTRAMHAAGNSELLLVGSFLNLKATVHFLQEQQKPVSLVCSGTGEDFALEDALLAAAMLDLLQAEHPWSSLHRAFGRNLEESLRNSRNGQRLCALGLEEDIRWCSQSDRYGLVVARDGEGFLRSL